MGVERGMKLLFCIIVLLGGGFQPAYTEASPIPITSITIEQWRSAEIELTSDISYSNPFLDVKVTATFIGPGGEVIIRPGFWDGEQTWKVRFAPTLVGTWYYSITSSDATNTGLTATGVVESVSYEGALDIYKHGFLTLSGDNRYLTYADGTPFFWLGDTHWFFDKKEAWDTANKPGWTSQFKGMVDRRVEQDFNVYQSVIFGPADQYWEEDQVGITINPEWFREKIDRKMAYIADAGLVNAFGVGFQSNIDNFVEGSERLAQYIVARYGSYPMVWITSGEGAGFDKTLRESRVDGWRKVAQEIHRYDAYDHPQAAHTPALTEKQSYGLPQFYEDEGWFDFEMLQGGHKKFVEAADYHYYRETYGLPVIESEANYEQINDGWATEARLRQSAYRSIQAGGFGFTYGANGIWNAAFDSADTIDDSGYGHENWFDAIDFPGGYQMTYMRDYYTSIPWFSLSYRPGDWAEWSGSYATETDHPVLSADDATNIVSVYFSPDTSSVGLLKQLGSSEYQARWFDPRTGQFTLITDSFTPSTGSWVVPEKPDAQDWLLLVEKLNPSTLMPEQVVKKTLVSEGKVATASSEDGQGASAAVDGNASSLWRAANGDLPQWIQLDLGRSYELTEITQRFGVNDVWNYKIEGSLDGLEWFNLIDRSDAAVFGEQFKERVSGTARYVKLTVTGSTHERAQSAEFQVFAKISSAAAVRSDWYLVNEDLLLIDKVPEGAAVTEFIGNVKPTLNGTLSLYEADGATPFTSSVVVNGMKVKVTSEDGTRTRLYILKTIDVNIALNATATASSVENGFYSASHVNDGINATDTWLGWSANQLPAWVELDFGVEKTFNKVELYTKAGYEQTEYTIQHWESDQWLNTFDTVTGNTSDHRTHLFPAVTSSKVRVYMTRGNVQQDGDGPNERVARLNELEIYSTSERAVESISVNGEGGAETISLPLGSLQMTAGIQPENASYRDVLWKVTDENDEATNVAVISPAGLLTAKNDGVVKVTATSTDGSGTKGEKLITLQNQPEPIVPVLLSRGKPVTVSTTLGNHAPASAITDGNRETSWVADGETFPQWFVIDLEDVYDLVSVDQTFNNEDQWKYLIEGSLDGNSWFELVNETSNTVSTINRAHTVTGEARYVRMTFMGAKEVWPNWASSIEFSVYGDQRAEVPIKVPVSLNKPATSSSVHDFAVAQRATDGDNSTSWVASGAGFPQWLQIDLQEVYNIDQIDQTFNNEDEWKYRIEASLDGVSWVTLVNRESNNQNVIEVSHNVQATARYIKLIVVGAKAIWPNWASSAEFSVYGD